MYCPACTALSEVEVNFKSDGYARNAYECGHCGAVWVLAKEQTVVIRDGASVAASHS